MIIINYILKHFRQIYNKDSLCIKLPMSNFARMSKTFNKVSPDELINKFIKASDIKEVFNIYFKIPKLIQNKTIKQIRIIPLFKGLAYNIIFKYIDDDKVIYKPIKNNNLIMAIDLGINNLATCVVTNNESFIIDERYLKSINHFYNKRLAHLKSKKPNNKIYTFMEHKVTKKKK